METVTLTREEYRAIWNARCSLSSIVSKLESVLHKELIVDLRKIQNQILMAQTRAQKEIDDEFDRRNAHYEFHAFPNSKWSMFEVENLETQHPYRATYMEYQGISRGISHCTTWLDLWEVADELIYESGDRCHIFIEGFHPVQGTGTLGPGTVLKLTTGS